jgi:hypothetical protein
LRPYFICLRGLICLISRAFLLHRS